MMAQDRSKRNFLSFFSGKQFLIPLAALLALGGALTERAGLGLSMVVIPAYISHVLISQTHSFFTFGMAEYTRRRSF